MKMLYELNERVEDIGYIKEYIKNLRGTLEICGEVYVFTRDKLITEQSIVGTITILQEYCQFLYKSVSELQDDMKVLLEDLQKNSR